MANPEHVKTLEQGVEAWNKWRMENPDIVPDLYRVDLIEADLSGALFGRANLLEAKLNEANLIGAKLNGANLNRANLNGANLNGANLNRANLNGANLNGANLNGATFNEARLSDANLSGVDLRRADLTAADLTAADLTAADLSGTNLWLTQFTSANIEGVNFTDSTMWGTIFANVDLSQANGLETVKHDGPSTIGLDTAERCQGKIPDVFLRGAGVRDESIGFIRAMGGAIQFYSCFISYSSKDQLFAERLYADLQARGVRCWFAPHDMQGGKKTHEQIDVAIQSQERVLLILSPESIHSEWVKTEIIKASNRERAEKRRMLFPVRLKITYEELKKWECFDGDTGKDLAREIREFYIPDFSEWESPKKFKEEFEKLVRDLKKAEAASAAEAG